LSPLPLPPLAVDALVRAALAEDLGRAGDVTTDAIVGRTAGASAQLAARKGGVVAGLDLAEAAFRTLDPDVAVERKADDGDRVEPGAVLAVVHGRASALLSAERTALNLVGHLSGVATATRRLVDLVAGTRARVVDTRKTTPGLRAAEKHAVRCGGGWNHRFGLDDAVLIKDNHLLVAGGITEAVRRVRAVAGHTVTIEVEVEDLAMVAEALDCGVGALLLDNMAPPLLAEAVALVAGRAVTEASGTITEATIEAVAASGVDLISVGWITHSAPSLDVGLDVVVDA
jgi:nicotinate-nucleotide pyrophosphorylase (carboxylating)